MTTRDDSTKSKLSDLFYIEDVGPEPPQPAGDLTARPDSIKFSQQYLDQLNTEKVLIWASDVATPKPYNWGEAQAKRSRLRQTELYQAAGAGAFDGSHHYFAVDMDAAVKQLHAMIGADVEGARRRAEAIEKANQLTKAQLADIIEKAAEVIERDGWVQNAYHSNGGHCGLGGIEVAAQELHDTKGAFPTRVQALANDHIRRLMGVNGVPAFNDTAGRTRDEVLTFLRDAARFLRKEYDQELLDG